MFKHYLTTALRHFRQHKLTTSINIVCLTIGLVCFLAIYATITYMKSGDTHYPNADRTYMITWSVDDSPVAAFGPWITAKYLKTDFPEIKTIARSTFDSGVDSEIPISAGEHKSFLHVVYADPEFLEVFAMPFLAGDSRQALHTPRSAVLSRTTAAQLFGNVQSATGKSLRLQDGTEIVVRGVVDELRQPSHISTTGENTMGKVRFDVMISMDVLEAEAASNSLKQNILENWLSPYVFTYVVLPEDGSFTVESMRLRLKEFGAKHASNGERSVEFGTWSVNDYWLSSMGALMGTHKTGVSATAMFYFLGAMVLLISCLNYANLATAQATTRAKEIGMRRVVGAHRGQIIWQFLLEAALLVLASLVFALAIALLAITSGQRPGAADVLWSVMKTPQFWLTLVSLLSSVTIAAGMYPAFVLSGVRPIQAVRTGKARGGRRFVPQLLVGLQFAGASFLLISMLVMMDQNKEFKRAVLTTISDPIVVLSNNIRATGMEYELFRTELLRQPHVQSVTASIVSPWMILMPVVSVSTSPNVAARVLQPTQSVVNYDFFATLGIKLLAGRDFDRAHANDSIQLAIANSQAPNVIIDRALAEQNGWLNLDDAVGKIFYGTELGQPRSAAQPWNVIGVVESRPMSVINPTGSPSNVYVLAPQNAQSPIVRVSRLDPAAGLKEIESVWNRLAPAVALKMRFADETLNRSYQMIEGVTRVFTGVATLAFCISILGLIGMSIHIIGRRQHEIGVRKTLGASVNSIVRLLLGDFSKPVIIANVLAWPLAYVAMQFYLSIFTQRTSLSPQPFLAGLAITVVVAWIAVAAQATRAARLNPTAVLRYE